MHAMKLIRFTLEETRKSVHLPQHIVLLLPAMFQPKPCVFLACFLQVPITKKSAYKNCFLVSCQTNFLHMLFFILSFPTSHGIILPPFLGERAGWVFTVISRSYIRGLLRGRTTGPYFRAYPQGNLYPLISGRI